MGFIRLAVLRGPNRWSSVSVLEARYEWAPNQRREPGRQAEPGQRSEPDRAARARLAAWLPELTRLNEQTVAFLRLTDRAGVTAAKRFETECLGGLSPAELLARLAWLFQAATGVLVEPPQVEETDEPHVDVVALPFEEEALARACLDTARVCLDAAHDGTEFDMPSMVRRLAELADDVRLGPSSRAIVSAAVARGIPFRRLNSGSLVQLGEGARQRRIWTAETDATSAIAESIAQDKELTKRLLHAVGVPVPLGRPVHSADDACEAAREIGPPIAVKPQKANHARGITLDISTEEQIRAAYDWAVLDGENTGVLVEQYVRGHAHRLLVVGERLVAAARGESEFVTGDGQRTIRELVDEENRDPRRGENYTDLLNLLKLDAAAEIELKKQGLTPDSIPAKGRKVLVHHVGDLTTDCTEQVHPDNARKAVLAARTIGLDIAGLDVIAEDISVPLEAQRGAVLEVNAGPGLSQHVAPLHGKPQPVGKAIVDLLFKPGANGRIPIIAVGGPGDRARLAEVIDERLRGRGLRVARATSAGLFFDGQRTNVAHSSDAAQVESLLVHPYADVAVFESRPRQAAAHGLGCERVDIAVLAGFATTPAAAISEGREDRRVDSVTMHHAIQALLNAVPPSGSYFAPPESQPGEALKLPRGQRRAWTSLDELADGVCEAASGRGR